MVKSFRCKDTERLFHGRFAKKLPHDIQRQALRKLLQIDAATDLAFLRTPPGNQLEALKGDRAGQHSVLSLSCFKLRDHLLRYAAGLGKLPLSHA